MKIYIVRHGETIQNSLNIYQGQSEGQLSEKGIGQAQKIAARLKDIHFDALFSSDLSRAYDTAAIIQNYHPSLVLKTDSRLRERYFAAFEGKPAPGYDINEQLPEGAESNTEIMLRIQAFWHDLLRANYQSVLLVSHGVAIKTLVCIMLNKNADCINQQPLVSNCSLSMAQPCSSGVFQLSLFNSCTHL